MLNRAIFLSVTLGVAALAVCQAPTPVVFTGGIVSAASLFPQGTPNYGAAPGAIVSIFGNNLTTNNQIAAASAIPLTNALGGTSVTIGGVAAPLFYVSPGQIN